MRQRSLCFLVPGDWNTPTGGYAYDRRIAQSLRTCGWRIEAHHLPGAWPRPDASALAAARSVLEALPDGALVLADGLAYGAMADVVRSHADRLRWVALVHHPLHMETGLPERVRARLLASESSALQWASRVVVTSGSTVRDVAAMGVPLDRIAVVEPGTDPVAAPGHGEIPSAGKDPVRLLCVATVTPRKGHELLLRALAGLGSRGWVLHNVGSLARDPEHAERMQAMCDKPELAAQVFWHGEVGADALRAHYAQADVFVLPSLHEGYGMAVAEAVSHGLPVLASDAGALASTVPADAGLLVPAGDAAMLREGLERLIREPGLRARLAAGARSAAQRLPDWGQQAARLAGVLEGMA